VKSVYNLPEHLVTLSSDIELFLKNGESDSSRQLPVWWCQQHLRVGTFWSFV